MYTAVDQCTLTYTDQCTAVGHCNCSDVFVTAVEILAIATQNQDDMKGMKINDLKT